MPAVPRSDKINITSIINNKAKQNKGQMTHLAL